MVAIPGKPFCSNAYVRHLNIRQRVRKFFARKIVTSEKTFGNMGDSFLYNMKE